MQSLIVWARRLRARDKNKAISALELALTLPVVTVVLLGVGELSHAVMLNGRVERIATSIGDITTQSFSAKISDLQMTTSAASQLMKPFPYGNSGKVIISSIGQNGPVAGITPPAHIIWQYATLGTAGGLTASTMLSCTLAHVSPAPTTVTDGSTYTVISYDKANPCYITPTTLIQQKFGGLKMAVGSNLLVTESYYLYTPLFPVPYLPFATTRQIIGTSLYTPRINPFFSPPT